MMAILRAMEVVARRKMNNVKPIPPPLAAGAGAGDDFFAEPF